MSCVTQCCSVLFRGNSTYNKATEMFSRRMIDDSHVVKTVMFRTVYGSRPRARPRYYHGLMISRTGVNGVDADTLMRQIKLSTAAWKQTTERGVADLDEAWGH